MLFMLYLFRGVQICVHQARVPRVLLAGDVQLLRQPYRLLLDEQKVDSQHIIQTDSTTR